MSITAATITAEMKKSRVSKNAQRAYAAVISAARGNGFDFALSDEVTEDAAKYGISANRMSGFVSTLSKKGFIEVHELDDRSFNQITLAVFKDVNDHEGFVVVETALTEWVAQIDADHAAETGEEIEVEEFTAPEAEVVEADEVEAVHLTRDDLNTLKSISGPELTLFIAQLKAEGVSTLEIAEAAEMSEWSVNDRNQRGKVMVEIREAKTKAKTKTLVIEAKYVTLAELVAATGFEADEIKSLQKAEG